MTNGHQTLLALPELHRRWQAFLVVGLDLAFYGAWIVSLALAVRRLPTAA